MYLKVKSDWLNSRPEDGGTEPRKCSIYDLYRQHDIPLDRNQNILIHFFFSDIPKERLFRNGRINKNLPRLMSVENWL